MTSKTPYFRSRRIAGGGRAYYFVIPKHVWREGMPCARSTPLGRDEYRAREQALALYSKIREWRQGKPDLDRRTSAWLFEEYRKHRLYRQCAPGTQKLYDSIRRSLDKAMDGNTPISGIPLDAFTPSAAEEMYFALADNITPRVARNILEMLRVLFKFGKYKVAPPVFSGDNPFAGLRLPQAAPKKTTIPAEHIRAIAAKAREIGEDGLALAVELNYYICQRPGDLISLRRADIYEKDGNYFFRIVQGKGRHLDLPPVNVPIPPNLLGQVLSKDDHIILTKSGKPFAREIWLQRRFRAVCESLGYKGPGYQIRYMRNSGITAMIAAGVTDAAATSISGHLGTGTLNKYYKANSTDVSLSALKTRLEKERAVSTLVRKSLNPNESN